MRDEREVKEGEVGEWQPSFGRISQLALTALAN